MFRKLIINLFGKLEQRDVVVVLEILLVILVDDRVHREADILPGEIGGDDDHAGEDYDDHQEGEDYNDHQEGGDYNDHGGEDYDDHQEGGYDDHV